MQQSCNVMLMILQAMQILSTWIDYKNNSIYLSMLVTYFDIIETWYNDKYSKLYHVGKDNVVVKPYQIESHLNEPEPYLH